MTQLAERLKEAYENGQQRGNNARPEFIRLYGGRALYPYRNLKDFLTPNPQDLIHDLRLLAVEAPRRAYSLGVVLEDGPLETIAYILGAYKSLVAIRA